MSASRLPGRSEPGLSSGVGGGYGLGGARSWVPRSVCQLWPVLVGLAGGCSHPPPNPQGQGHLRGTRVPTRDSARTPALLGASHRPPLGAALGALPASREPCCPHPAPRPAQQELARPVPAPVSSPQWPQRQVLLLCARPSVPLPARPRTALVHQPRHCSWQAGYLRGPTLPSLAPGHLARAQGHSFAPPPFTLQAGRHQCPTSPPSTAVLQISGAGWGHGG